MRSLVFLIVILAISFFLPLSAFAQAPASASGYTNCLTQAERRGTLNSSEVCALTIQCEQRIADGRHQLVARNALCRPIARNNRCPEALDCIADPSVTEADIPNIINRQTTRASWDSCPTAAAGTADAPQGSAQ